MRIAGFEWRASPLPTLAAAIAFCGLAMLGHWQLNRADEKGQILAHIEQAGTLPAVNALTAAQDWTDHRYRKITIDGRLDLQHQFLQDNQIQDGKVGFKVLTPLYSDDLKAGVLLDRGFIAQGADRVPLQDPGAKCTARSFRAWIYQPLSEGFRLGTMDEGQQLWPRTVQFIDFAQMGKRLGTALEPAILRLEADQDCGFERAWEPVGGMSPLRHLAYAVQWFALAATVAVIFLALSLRRAKS